MSTTPTITLTWHPVDLKVVPWNPMPFYEDVTRQGISPEMLPYLPSDHLRIVVLIHKGWWLGYNWRTLKPPGRAISYHGPNGEFTPDMPPEVLSMSKAEMLRLLLPAPKPPIRRKV
jgi:hypothetical protein